MPAVCVLPVKLAPGSKYALWINSPGHDAFRDTSQKSAVPYLLVFETAQAPARRRD